MSVSDHQAGGVLAPHQPLPWWERAGRVPALRSALILAALAILWQLYAGVVDNPLLLPSFSETLAALGQNLASGVLPQRALSSLSLLLIGYGLGLLLAAILTIAAISSRLGSDLLRTLTMALNPLPAIALVPVALLWFGLGAESLVFVLVHAVLWPMALNTHAGFLGVSETLRMVGRNYGLGGLRFVWAILVPAAFPAILTGARVSWAFAWRTLIAAEMVFGVASGSGGLGWFIYENRSQLETANVFAGLISICLIGIVVDLGLFAVIEARTVRRWGMQRP